MSHDTQISAERRPGYLLIKLPSVVSMDNYIDVEKDIDALLGGKSDRIVLDLTDTSNIYSSGMGLMIRLNKKVIATGGQMCLVNVSERCRKILVSVHLDKVLPMYATDVEFEVSQEEVWNRRAPGS